MGSPYTSVSATGYNANPPPDDGSATEANRITWATIKTKLADVIKTLADAINTNVVAAFGKVAGGITTTSISYQVVSSDQGKTVIGTTASITVTTPDATDVGAPFKFKFVNNSTGSITLDGSGTQTIDGSGSIVVPANNGVDLDTDGSNWFTGGQNFTRSFPPPSSYKGLSIKVASNTTVAVSADFVSTTNGTQYQTTAVSSTINLGTTGADALDTGTIAIDTWYAIWVIAKADGTTKCLASTSATSPTMPTDYTYKARIGWVRTIHASATLYGTWQLGRKARYVIGLAQTSAFQTPATGNTGTPATPTWVSATALNYVPSTASIITLIAAANGNSASAIAAPNNGYGGNADVATKAPPLNVTLPASNYGLQGSGATNTQTADLMLESSSFYVATVGSTGTYIGVVGWEDNI